VLARKQHPGGHVPAATDHEHHEVLTVDFEVDDDLSGVYTVAATLDDVPVDNGDPIDLLTLSLGQHTLRVVAEDTADNSAEATVDRSIIATPDSLQATVYRLLDSGEIDKPGIANSLVAKIEAPRAPWSRQKVQAYLNRLDALVHEVEAQRGKHISEWAADLLITDALAVQATLRSTNP
jgi:hypothetical protein